MRYHGVVISQIDYHSNSMLSQIGGQVRQESHWSGVRVTLLVKREGQRCLLDAY